MIEQEEPDRDLAGLGVPLAGRLAATGDRWEPYRLLDPGGVRVAAAAAYFGHLQAAGRSELTIRSYGMDLLRWFRFLWAIGVPWNHAVRSDARGFLPVAAGRGETGPAALARAGSPWCRAAGGGFGRGLLAVGARALRDGAAQLLRLSRGGRHRAAGPGSPVTRTARHHTLRRAAVILAAKGGMLAGIAVGDVLELPGTEAGVPGAAKGEAAACYRLLRQLGTFGPAAPARLRELRTAGQRTPEEMTGRHNLACRPIRDLLAGYLRERQPGMDYGSLNNWPASWACSGRTWKPTIPASTACT